jgi:hypothetical protein
MLELFKSIYSFIVYMISLPVLFGLLVVAALNVLVGAGVLLCVGRPSCVFMTSGVATDVSNKGIVNDVAL